MKYNGTGIVYFYVDREYFYSEYYPTRHSCMILTLLSSGEFHTFRLPVPSLWPDILQKFKAAGLNALSLYTHMGLINPAPGVVDFDGFRALQPFFDAAKDAGIWIVLRPGVQQVLRLHLMYFLISVLNRPIYQCGNDCWRPLTLDHFRSLWEVTYECN